MPATFDANVAKLSTATSDADRTKIMQDIAKSLNEEPDRDLSLCH